jgi:hypothetical protein
MEDWKNGAMVFLFWVLDTHYSIIPSFQSSKKEEMGKP